MKILITNYELISWAGSEVVTLELARELTKLGHQVFVFTSVKGTFSFEFVNLGIDVLDMTDIDRIRDLDIDVVHCHHWPLVQALFDSGIKIPTVFGFLGVIPPLENPPPTDKGYLWWSVSEEVEENVLSQHGWLKQNTTLIRNWAPEINSEIDTFRHRQLRRVAVVSNHFPASYWELLNTVAQKMDFSLTKFGFPEKNKYISPETLMDYDALVTIGKTAITAMRLGIPVLMLDVHGADGWLTSDNYFNVRKINFSGRYAKQIPELEMLTNLFLNLPNQDQLNDLSLISREDHRLDLAVKQLESLYVQAINIGQFQGFPKFTSVSTHLFLKREAVVAERDAVVAERDAVVAERDAVVAERDAVVAERDAVVAERDAVVAERDAITSSRIWRWTKFFRGF